MPGQEKMIMEYYQKNSSAADSLRGTIYENKIIESIKSKAKKNDTIKVEATLPENFPEKELTGKKAIFQFLLKFYFLLLHPRNFYIHHEFV